MTEDILVEGILIRAGARNDVAAHARAITDDGRMAVVADARVIHLHGDLRIDAPRLELTGGENAKTFGTLERVLEFCVDSKLSRASVLIALGGGTIGDITGLAASLYKRGISLVQVPTTLLAQVDASIGGKTAVNLASGKNLAGTFHLPKLVACDPEFLTTLSESEYRSGLGEVIKTAIVGGEESLASLEENATAISARQPEALAATIAECIRTKSKIVRSDPEERGPRRALNLGHTFAHAIEHAAGYGAVPHGVAVGVGLALAARAAAELDAGAEALCTRTLHLLRSFGLPSSIDELRSDLNASLAPDALFLGFGHDKKGAVDAPEFVLARAPGTIDLGITLRESLLRELLR